MAFIELETEEMQQLGKKFIEISDKIHDLKKNVTELNTELTNDNWTGEDADEFMGKYRELEKHIDNSLAKLEGLGPLMVNFALNMESTIEENKGMAGGMN